MNRSNKFYSTLTQNKISIFIQILLSLLLINQHEFIILYLYVLMIEFIIIDINDRFPLKYNQYLLIKFIFLFSIFLNDSTYLNILYSSFYQIFIYFFSKENSKIFKKNINRYISFIILILITIYIFSIGWKNLNVIHLFLGYPFIYLSLLHLDSLNISKTFCKKNEYHNNNYLLYLLRSTPLSFLLLVGTLSLSFLFVTDYNFITIAIGMISLVLSVVYEKNDYYRYQNSFHISIYKYYSIPIIFVILTLVSYWLININIENSIYKDYVLSTYSAITNIAILNIASLLVIIQLNYQKYGSAYLLIKIIKSKFLLFVTLLPSILILLNIYILSETAIKYSFVPTLFLVLSLISTLLLFLYTNIFLETNIIIRQLFNSITNNDFKNYKNNIINMKESNIDSILKIITKVLENNDSTTSRSLFFNLMCWAKLNIHNIEIRKAYYFEHQNSKFYDFFKILVSSIVSSNNNVVHKNFIDSINEMILRNNTSTNYMSYTIIYEFLFEYLILMLHKKEEKTSKDIYNIIFRNSAEILLNLEFHEVEKYDMVKHSNDLSNFKSTFVEKLNKVVEVSIEQKNIEFLKYMDIYKKLFELGYKNNKPVDSRAKWDGKVFDIFIETRYLKERIDKFLIQQNVYWFSITRDYNLFVPYSHMWSKNTLYRYDDKIKNYVIDRLVSLYSYAIENEKINSEYDFEIIWVQLYGSIKYNDENNFKIYTTLFTYFIDLICMKNIDNTSLIKSVWDRLVFIYENEELAKCDFKTYMKTKIDALSNKYPELDRIHNINYNHQRISEMDILTSFDITKPSTE